MTRRRGRGEGSIYRRKDGSWVAQYTTGGKRRYIYGKTRKDVAARLNKAIAERPEAARNRIDPNGPATAAMLSKLPSS